MPAGEWETIQTVDPSAIRLGSDFGPRYRIEALLGQGGMGRVYKAYDKELSRTVAIKVVRPGMMGEEDALGRFKQELILASKISHKNILRIHDLGEVNDMKFISMAYVEGQDLYQIMKANPKLPLDRVLKYATQLAGALAAAHAEDVVHRDLKPQNILCGRCRRHDPGRRVSRHPALHVSRTGSGKTDGWPIGFIRLRHHPLRNDYWRGALRRRIHITGDVPAHSGETQESQDSES